MVKRGSMLRMFATALVAASAGCGATAAPAGRMIGADRDGGGGANVSAADAGDAGDAGGAGGAGGAGIDGRAESGIVDARDGVDAASDAEDSAQPDAPTADTEASPAIDGGNTRFSFFVTSLRAMQRLSGSPAGFGGDLRFGQSDGLAGADEICRQIAETSLPGSGAKGWRAFLSVTKGPGGQPVHAVDRVGEGPWYDRLGRLVANNKADLVQARPKGDPLIANDLPNEDGVPNHAPDGVKVDNHDILTGSNTRGRLSSPDWRSTCQDWSSKVGRDGQPRVGHSWPRRFGPGFPVGAAESWISALDEAGCAPGVNLVEMGPPDPNVPTVGSGGGYGGIYCFALSP